MSQITTNWVPDLAKANVQIANLKGDVADLRAALEEISMQAENVKLGHKDFRFKTKSITEVALANEQGAG
jgi:TolA-binding protein